MAATEAATTSAPESHGGRSEGAAAALSERLYARHQSLVLGLCRGLLRDPVESEDAAQQTFLSAHRALLNGAEPREPAAWLATIARNECWARTSARMREPLPSDAMHEVATTSDPVQEAIRRADLHALWLAIKQLPRQQRDALLLREFGGLRYDELAVALAVSEPSVESLLFRARTRLRTQLKAAYASLSDVSLASLARLLAGGGAPALATKAVALTVGAAAVTGSAVVAPQVFENHKHVRRVEHVRTRAHVVHHVAVQTPTIVEAAVTPAPRPVVPAPPTGTRETEHEVERRVTTTTASHEGEPSRSVSHEGEGEHATTSTVVTTTIEQHEGSSSSGTSGSSGTSDGSSHDGSGDGGGDDGSDGSGH